MMDIEATKQEVRKLIEKYNKVVEEKRVIKYNEENTKKDFILPLFHALGWNTEDSNEVTAEEIISKKRVDYGFRINGIPKFFLEAKALKEDLENRKFIEQAINYAWHKGCTWAILINFEGLKVYNAEWKTLNPFQNIFLSFSWDNYLDRFERLVWLSKESFEKGILDKEAESLGKKTKKISVDKQLLNDFTRFRDLLSKNIIKLNQNKNLTEEDLDESVQRILDRLIFIRNCEDRELEARTLISSFREWESRGRGQLIKSLREIFAYFDKQYNSKIFVNHLCDNLEIDNEVLHEIIEGLYYTKDKSVSYDFSAIEADVLGNIYEQYLGHILKKSEKRAKLTENHIHRKEQGIYYTPTYIVDYIVRNSLNELVKDKKLNEILKIRILDPACGSGSFLIRGFSELCKVVEERLRNGERSNEIISMRTYKDRLTLSQKIFILLNCICGVDLDKKAVEIAQLNLLLKLLNGESRQTLSNVKEMKRLLPMLNNIKVGNSLIDDPAIAGDKAFKWEEEFKEAMQEGGFDVVIGNPPYGIVFKENEKHFIEEKLPTFRRNNDLYVAFMEKAISLLKEGGLFSFIIPNTYLIGSYFDNLKRFILEKTKIIKILDLGTNHVFQDPNVFNSIIILQKESNLLKKEKNKIKFFDVPLLKNEDFFKLEAVSLETEITQPQFSDLSWKPKNKIIEKINKQKDNIIDDVCYVKDVGFNYWSIGRGKKRGGSIGSRILYDRERKHQKDVPYLKGRDINRYSYVFGNHWLKHNYETYLDKKVDIFRFSPKFLEVSPKIIYRQTADRIIATIDFDKYYLDKTAHLIIPKENVKLNLLSLLGVLNSKLMLYFYRYLVREEGRTFAQVKTIYIKKIPLKFNEQLENKISELVKKQLDRNKLLNEIGDKKTDERARIEEEIKKTDNEIDEIVYKIYGITEEERKIIEESLK